MIGYHDALSTRSAGPTVSTIVPLGSRTVTRFVGLPDGSVPAMTSGAFDRDGDVSLAVFGRLDTGQVNLLDPTYRARRGLNGDETGLLLAENDDCVPFAELADGWVCKRVTGADLDAIDVHGGGPPGWIRRGRPSQGKTESDECDRDTHTFPLPAGNGPRPDETSAGGIAGQTGSARPGWTGRRVARDG